MAQGFLTGFALTPISVYVILLLEQTRHLGIDLVDQLGAAGRGNACCSSCWPVVRQRALIPAGESADSAKERKTLVRIRSSVAPRGAPRLRGWRHQTRCPKLAFASLPPRRSGGFGRLGHRDAAATLRLKR